MLDFHMSSSTSTYVGFSYSVIHSTWNISFAAWAIFSPTNEMVSSGGIYLGPTTNNNAEYSAIIKLLFEAIALNIHKLVFKLGSQLVVSLLNHVYLF
jgi:ribonuclease HI